MVGLWQPERYCSKSSHVHNASLHASLHGPPIPARHPVVHRAHGDKRIDEYAWLRDRDDSAVIAHLEAENAWTERALAHLGPLRERVYSEIVARVQQSDTSAPIRHGPYVYYTRTVEGRQYAMHCRRRLVGGGEQILLDENACSRRPHVFPPRRRRGKLGPRACSMSERRGMPRSMLGYLAAYQMTRRIRLDGAAFVRCVRAAKTP